MKKRYVIAGISGSVLALAGVGVMGYLLGKRNIPSMAVENPTYQLFTKTTSNVKTSVMEDPLEYYPQALDPQQMKKDPIMRLVSTDNPSERNYVGEEFRVLMEIPAYTSYDEEADHTLITLVVDHLIDGKTDPTNMLELAYEKTPTGGDTLDGWITTFGGRPYQERDKVWSYTLQGVSPGPMQGKDTTYYDLGRIMALNGVRTPYS